jgi:lysyl-tRNA synthetase class 2
VLLRSLLSTTRGAEGHSPADHARAAAIVRAYASDSLDPFALRADKSFHFAHHGLLAYRVVRETAVVAGDPIGPPGSAPAILADFRQLAARRGWEVVVTGASARHLGAYRRLGYRGVRIGNEAIVDPRAFSLEGRAIRKVRQSVTRLQRRGWTMTALDAGELSEETIGELAAVDLAWGASQPRLHGFAMTLGRLWGAAEDEDGVYVLARDSEGVLRSFLRFARYRQGLSLDVMRRSGGEPNGVNEALVVAALEYARAEGLHEVSLNFAGFAHVMANGARLTLLQRLLRGILRALHGRFQFERLVRFNDKFFPEWRPRFLVHQGGPGLPLGGLRVLQAEAYLPRPRAHPRSSRWQPLPLPVRAMNGGRRMRETELVGK